MSPHRVRHVLLALCRTLAPRAPVGSECVRRVPGYVQLSVLRDDLDVWDARAQDLCDRIAREVDRQCGHEVKTKIAESKSPDGRIACAYWCMMCGALAVVEVLNPIQGEPSAEDWTFPQSETRS